MREPEEIAPLVRRDLYQSRRVVRAALKTRTCFGIDTDHFLRPQIVHRLLHLLGLVHYDHFAFKRHQRHPLKQILTDMMRLISHGWHVIQLIVCDPNGQRMLAGIPLPHRS